MSPSTPRESGVASVEEIRRHFPALERRHGAETVAYFDGPGGTQVPRSVAAAMSDYLFHHNANRHWAFATSIETDAALWGAREVLADFVGGAPSEVVFGANMTTLTFHLARALGRRWSPGDEIVVTELDHHANVDPWRAVASERGLVVKAVPFDVGTGQLDREALESSVGPRTRLLAIGAASNALGTVNDVSRAAALARAAGALLFVDAVHSAPHVLPDVRALEADILVCSAYKFYGPHVGVLWARQGLLESLDVPKLEPAANEAPDRLETGTLNHEGILGAATAVDFLASLVEGPDRRTRLTRLYTVLHERGQKLFERLWAGLGAEPDVTRFGPSPDAARTPTLSFVVDGSSAEGVARTLAGRGVFVSHGDFYATTVARRLGRAEGGMVRAGCACYTTESEVDRLIEGVAAVARQGDTR